MAPLYFGPYGRVHLLERLRPPAISEHSGDILRPGWSKDRRRLEQHPLWSILDHQAGAGLPMPALANCLGQDDLSLVDTVVVSGSAAAISGLWYGR